jgi:hypothetical protein
MPEKSHEAHKDDWFQDHPFGDELKSLHNIEIKKKNLVLYKYGCDAM